MTAKYSRKKDDALMLRCRTVSKMNPADAVVYNNKKIGYAYQILYHHCSGLCSKRFFSFAFNSIEFE